MVREIQLTQGYIALVDDEDYEYLNQFQWYPLRRKQACYAQRIGNSNKERIYMHREIMQAKPSQEVDHWDHNGLNNRRQNLRPCTHAQNSQNCITKIGVSGFKGVYWNKHGRRWFAAITANGKTTHLGCFTNKIAAALAYNEAALQLHCEFAYLNDIPIESLALASKPDPECMYEPRTTMPLDENDRIAIEALTNSLANSGMQRGPAARYAEVVYRRKRNEPFSAIGVLFGTSRQRIQQIEQLAWARLSEQSIAC